MCALRRVSLFALSICALSGLAAIPATAATVMADFAETLDLFNSGSGPRVLESLGVTAAGGPELTEADEIANPSNWFGSLEVDLDPITLQLALTPTFPEACYGYITVQLDGVSISGPVDDVHGLERLQAGAFAPNPNLERTATFGPSYLTIDSRVMDGGACNLDFAGPPGADRYRLNPPDRTDTGFAGSTLRFHEEANVLDGMSAGPRVLEVSGVQPGPGYELTDSDEVANPSGYGDSLEVDLDPDTGLLTLTPTNGNCYGEIEVTLDQITFAVPGTTIQGVLFLGSGAFAIGDPGRSVSFTPDSLVIDYKLTNCDLQMGDGSASDTYRVLTAPEPGAETEALLALAAVGLLAARRRDHRADP